LQFIHPSYANAAPPKKFGDSPPDALSLNAVTASVFANNPAIKAARAKWESMKQRVPQAAAWDDLKISASSRLGRFVDVATNSFTTKRERGADDSALR
jgi:outer membrane protein TolC